MLNFIRILLFIFIFKSISGLYPVFSTDYHDFSYIDRRFSYIKELRSKPYNDLDELDEKIQLTYESFKYLFINSQVLSQLPQAQPINLIDRMHYIFTYENKFDTPDCPELELLDSAPTHEMYVYQKLNRYLFDEVDEALKQSFLKSSAQAINFSFPVVEWTTNVLPMLDIGAIDETA